MTTFARDHPHGIADHVVDVVKVALSGSPGRGSATGDWSDAISRDPINI
jgi:hypothetical protein